MMALIPTCADNREIYAGSDRLQLVDRPTYSCTLGSDSELKSTFN